MEFTTYRKLLLLKRFLATAIVLAGCLSTYTSLAAQDNKGKDFILPFLPNYTGANVIQLHLTSDTNTDVLIEYPVNSPTFSTTVTLTPGDITLVDIPLTAGNWTSGVVANNAVRTTADNEFVTYMVNLRRFTSDAALGLPIDTMNTQYIVASYQQTQGRYGTQLNVYAAYDNTTVTITPSVDLAGHSAGTPFTVNLKRGEAYYAEARSGDLSSTIIEANRPVGLVNGVECVNVPNRIWWKPQHQ